jgi:hypothetical protein
MDVVHPNKAVHDERLAYFRSDLSPNIHRWLDKQGPAWSSYEWFVDAGLQPEDREEITRALFDFARSEAKKAGATFFHGGTEGDSKGIDKLGFEEVALFPMGLVQVKFYVHKDDR